MKKGEETIFQALNLSLPGDYASKIVTVENNNDKKDRCNNTKNHSSIDLLSKQDNVNLQSKLLYKKTHSKTGQSILAIGVKIGVIIHIVRMMIV